MKRGEEQDEREATDEEEKRKISTRRRRKRSLLNSCQPGRQKEKEKERVICYESSFLSLISIHFFLGKRWKINSGRVEKWKCKDAKTGRDTVENSGNGSSPVPFPRRGARLKVVGHAITPSLVNTYTVGHTV